jgi:hypothetical protein
LKDQGFVRQFGFLGKTKAMMILDIRTRSKLSHKTMNSKIIGQQHTEFFNYHSLSPNELTQYRDEGYLIIPSILKPAGVREMTDECMKAWEQEKRAFDPDKTWLQNSLLPNIHHKSSLVRDFYFEGPLVDIAEQLVGPNVKGATSQLTFKMRGNAKPFAWHQDNGYGELEPYNAITCLTALEDNDEETGCLWLIPRSQRQGQRQLERTEEDRRQGREVVMEVDESGAIPMPMKAGDCLIMTCWTLHKSEGNFSQDRDRRVLFLRYADADAVEVTNGRKPRLGRLLRGKTRFPEVSQFESEL